MFLSVSGCFCGVSVVFFCLLVCVDDFPVGVDVFFYGCGCFCL